MAVDGFWEDVSVGEKRRCGPFTITTDMLQRFLEVVGDQYALHRDSAFAEKVGNRGPILPGTLIHAAIDRELDAFGREHGEGFSIQLAALRSVTFDFVRPMYPEEPFWVETEVEAAEPVTDALGTVNLVRRIMDDSGAVFSISRVRIAVVRRGA